MRPFSREELAALLAPHSPPCVSVAMPCHRRLPEAQQNGIRYGNLLRQVGTTLEKEHGKRDAGSAHVMGRLQELANGPDGFWTTQSDGLAVFASPDHFSWYRVPSSLREITVVADTFHVKPLLPLLFDDLRYQVLALTQKDVTVHEGNGDHVEQLTVPGMPRNLTEALGGEWDDSHDGMTFHGSPGRAMGPGSTPGGSGAGGQHFHGSGDADSTNKVELERFFRAVDRAVNEKVSKVSKLPLILAAVDYYHPIFRGVSKNTHLLERGIQQDPKSLDKAQLLAAAWAVFEPRRAERLARILEEFGTAQAHGLGSSDLPEVARAAAASRVKTLLIESNRRVWGRLDRVTGDVTVSAQEGRAGDADLLDDLAELVLSRGGDVLMAPAARMPTTSGVASIHRF